MDVTFRLLSVMVHPDMTGLLMSGCHWLVLSHSDLVFPGWNSTALSLSLDAVYHQVPRDDIVETRSQQCQLLLDQL